MILLKEDIFALELEKFKIAKSYISETGCYLQQLLTLLLKPEQKKHLTVIQRKIKCKPAEFSSAEEVLIKCTKGTKTPSVLTL